MILVTQIKQNIKEPESRLEKKICSYLHLPLEELLSVKIVRRSIDARKKPDIFFIYSCVAEVKNESKAISNIKKFRLNDAQPYSEKVFSFDFPEKCPAQRPLIVGFGPAGIFAALVLARAGLRPMVFERGRDVKGRSDDVNSFWLGDKLNKSSNVQFGEGGAGTFSDGKLNTLIKDKDGCMNYVLNTFVEFGAAKDITYDAKPHIGTDKLVNIISGIREEIIRLGGEIHFSSLVTDFYISDGHITGLRCNEEDYFSDNIILACGHSARETFERLNELNVPMSSKPFAVGFRVEHPQEMIDKALYGGSNELLGPGAYKVAAKTKSGRGAYSFCMCPGGFVVNASSEDEKLCVNGMSYSDRGSLNANSAILTAISADYFGTEILSGMKFQREIETRAYKKCNGKIPVQRLGDFRRTIENGVPSVNSALNTFSPCIKGQYEYADITDILPMELNRDILEGFVVFDRIIPGFNRDDAVLIAVESRSSSPVKIHRNEWFESDIKGFYPIGEGAGFAGGIVSAAVDGARCAAAILKKIHYSEGKQDELS